MSPRILVKSTGTASINLPGSYLWDHAAARGGSNPFSEERSTPAESGSDELESRRLEDSEGDAAPLSSTEISLHAR